MKLDARKSALLSLDCQKGIFSFAPGSEVILPNAVKAADFARQGGLRVIHVGLGFAEGHPEIPSSQSVFKRLKESDAFVKGSPSAEFASELVKPKDLIVYKQRVSAFSENQLHMILRANGIENLIFFGIATSGIVLSTLRQAFDLDYQCTILKDACFDRDPEVHRVLTEKVFASQARVIGVDAFIAEEL